MPKGTKTLKDVAKVYKTKALQAINPGVPYKGYKTGTSKAFKTGNLYNKVAGSNKPDTMFVFDKQTEKYTFNFRIAPSGADYGKYVHNGTRKMQRRPFGELAAESPEFKKAINEFMNGKVGDKLSDIFEGFDKKAKKSGLEVS